VTPPGDGAGRARLAAAAWALGLALLFTLDDPRLRFEAHLAGYALAAAGWWGLARAAPTGRALRAVVAAAVLARVWALALPPAFSEDVFRYVYEGRLVWVLGPGAPFAHPPAAGPTLGLPPGLLDEAWLRINHPELSTIYPPLAQLAFAGAGGLGELVGGHHLLLLKATLVAADLGTFALLAAALRAANRPAAGALWYGACPLVILEVAREGHADSLSALGLALAVFAFARRPLRPRLGYLGFTLAALAKLNGLVALPAALRETRRGLWVAAGCALLALPWLLAGPGAGAGLSEYATRWRAGDGAFSLLLWVAEALLGGDWAQVAGHTVTRHQLARGLAALCFSVGAVVILRPAGQPVAARAGHLLLLLLLLSPTLHPWYVLWVLPFAAAAEGFTGRRAVLALAALSVGLHHPGWLELETGVWTDLGGVRAAVHLPVWGLWLWDLVRATKPR
jgi:hypothetical protein